MLVTCTRAWKHISKKIMIFYNSWEMMIKNCSPWSLYVLRSHHQELFPWDKDHKILWFLTALPAQRTSQLLDSQPEAPLDCFPQGLLQINDMWPARNKSSKHETLREMAFFIRQLNLSCCIITSNPKTLQHVLQVNNGKLDQNWEKINSTNLHAWAFIATKHVMKSSWRMKKCY